MQLRGKMGRLGLVALAVATLAAGAGFLSPAARAQSPLTVPAARFYGTVRLPNGQPVSNLTVTASIGNTVCSGTQSITGGPTSSSTDNSGNYQIDIQSVPGCTTPGSSVKFSASGGQAGSYNFAETGTLPDIPGTAVRLNLTVRPAATPTPPPPPPPPTRAATQPPPPPPPPPAATTVRPPTPVVTATPARSPVSQQAPKGPVAQGPAKGPVYAQGPKTAQAPRAVGGGPVYVAPAAAARLPSTGTGGLLDQQASTSLTGWALAVIVLAGLGISATGLFAYRRSR